MSFFGKNIRKIRTLKKLSQTDFADLFGLNRTTVGAYEEGRSEPKIDTIIQIANHFGISIDMMVKKDITVNDILHFNVEQLLSTPNPKSNASNEISLINSKILDAFFENPTNKALFASCEKIQIPIFRSKPLIAFHSDCFSDIQKQNFPATEFIFICSEKQDIQTVSYQKFVYFLSHQRQLCFSDSLDSAAVCIWQIEFILAPFNSYYSSIFEKIEQINSKLDKFSLD